ncbi:4-hydroxy-tetrahydrodipicolinate synthase [Amaricoccus sp.]|uniref:4-hydroxy-tetrahydrodipicolinate synthase n=1 Tax=Amaricoccus sp. TaxID=1872485 RepID=UPI001D300C59|nr:4-hydroxy-tetrahydrodipicolinate synthase [Amaricoccus sp.]MCB1402704.1 4-hydroxy-tetrahydrodipicolinate synthase [Paracoccaceae bacterium]MCC0066539.1 4-hydroxy-tetrahydrodipicolinate synthase [Rhodovulum sp.]HRW16167.1 4-hydroxy-tetrahydrodipicolinate synthase [Amaricoccus sp.]
MFRGSIPALITPFRDGGIDEKALVDLVEWHVEEGSHGLVAVGTTGETPTLSHEEHERCVEIVVRTAAGRIPVIAGAGSNNTAESVRLMAFAKSVGADAALVVTPYYNKPGQRGLYHHYRTLHDAVDLPIIIYNIPGRSVIDMSPATMGELAKLPRIIGVKDATGDIGRVSDTRIACGRDFLQLCGNDDVALGFNAHGGRGCISVVGNIAPRLCAEFQEATLAGDFARALELQDRLMPLHRAAFAESNPCPTKYALSVLGKCSDEVRSPMVTVEAATRERMEAAMRHAGLLN